MTLRLGVIGYPLQQSISPAFQQGALNHLGLDARYHRWETPPDQLGRRIGELRSSELLGFNVTVPHKETIFPFLDEVAEEARSIGAVNVVVHRDGRLIGHNTDAGGFLRALREDGGCDPQGLHVLVLGAGGAARAVCFALLRAGASSLTIANRTVERARALVEAMGAHAAGTRIIPLEEKPLASVRSGTPAVGLIVNCTTLGMRHGPTPDASPLDAGLVPSGALVYDLIYNPPETPLLQAARHAGARGLGGLPMLVYQGAEAFRLWTGQEPPVEIMLQAARRALETA